MNLNPAITIRGSNATNYCLLVSKRLGIGVILILTLHEIKTCKSNYKWMANMCIVTER